MSLGSKLPFQFTRRGRNFRDASGAEFARIVEDRDRELEEFLAGIAAAAGIRIVGSIPTVGPPGFPGSEPGDIWIDSDGDGWAWDGDSWTNVGPIQGPPGPTGPAGPQGPPGTGGGGDGSSGFTFMQATPPVATRDGETWFDTATGLSYVWYIDLDSPQWVNFAPGTGSGGGGGVEAASYVHNQGVSAAVWDISHDLGWFPNVTVIDSAGRTVEGDLIHLSDIALRLTFSGAFIGIAYLS